MASKNSLCLNYDIEQSKWSRCSTSFGWGRDEHCSSDTFEEFDCWDRSGDNMAFIEEILEHSEGCLCSTCCYYRNFWQDDQHSTDNYEEYDFEGRCGDNVSIIDQENEGFTLKESSGLGDRFKKIKRSSDDPEDLLVSEDNKNARENVTCSMCTTKQSVWH